MCSWPWGHPPVLFLRCAPGQLHRFLPEQGTETHAVRGWQCPGARGVLGGLCAPLLSHNTLLQSLLKSNTGNSVTPKSRHKGSHCVPPSLEVPRPRSSHTRSVALRPELPLLWVLLGSLLLCEPLCCERHAPTLPSRRTSGQPRAQLGGDHALSSFEELAKSPPRSLPAKPAIGPAKAGDPGPGQAWVLPSP